MSSELREALSDITKESKRLACHYGRMYAISHDPDDRAKSIWYSAQLRLAENIHYHFTGGAEENGSEPSPWDPKEDLEAIGWIK